MKKLLLLFTILIFFACDEPVKIDSAEWSGTISASDERNTIMNSFTDAYENMDKESALSIFSENAVFHVNDAQLTASEVVDAFMLGHEYFDDIKNIDRNNSDPIRAKRKPCLDNPNSPAHSAIIIGQPMLAR